MAGPTPLALGGHAFEALGFGFEEMSRDQQTPWSEIEVAGRLEALHWTGPKSESRTIKGVLFPEAFGGLDTLDAIAADAKAGRIMPLVTGAGRMLGRFVVTGVQDDASAIDERGRPRKDAYTLTLRRYEPSLAALGGFGSGAIGFFTQALAGGLTNAVSGAVASFAGNVVTAASAAASGLVATAAGGFAGQALPGLAAQVVSGQVRTITDAAAAGLIRQAAP